MRRDTVFHPEKLTRTRQTRDGRQKRKMTNRFSTIEPSTPTSHHERNHNNSSGLDSIRTQRPKVFTPAKQEVDVKSRVAY